MIGHNTPISRRHQIPSYLTRLFSLCIATASLTATAAQTDTARPPAAEAVADLDAALLQVLEQTHTPGLIGTVVFGDRVVWTGALGVADRQSRQPVTAEHRFRIGSITKSFTSLVALILAERGELKLSSGLQALIPEAGIDNPWAASDPVRLYHTLEHTAGFDDIHLREYAFSDPDITLLEGIQFNTTSRQSRWRPGTRMAYSNIGPAIAALAMSKVRGQPFEAIAEAEVLVPLGMSSTSYFHHPDVVSSYREDGETPEPYMHIADRPAGLLERLARCGDRTGAHQRRIDAGGRP